MDDSPKHREIKKHRNSFVISHFHVYLHPLRRNAGVVDRAALEMRCTGNCTGGSNPSFSATNKIPLTIEIHPIYLYSTINNGRGIPSHSQFNLPFILILQGYDRKT